MSGTGGSADREPNHLRGQTSPYLLQHLYNPVDWYPWGTAALEKARSEDKPIFLSVGYAACHWCHVMERESFENPEIAEFLNRHFVSIKVDREERPDVDEIYMNAVQVMTGSGGWPLSVFLLPDLRPFVGGTYFPPVNAMGRIGFLELLGKIHEAWNTHRDEIDRSASSMTDHLRRIAAAESDAAERGSIGPAEAARAQYELAQRFDAEWGGFGQAPKFPPDGAVRLLLNEHARSGERVALEMAEKTLDAMALGGMYDHVGGGFARYSVDEKWLVPHFEKMLYNQALLVPLYLDAWRITGKPLYRRVAEQTLDFVRRELTSAQGGFFSSLDADSEGEEGKFYVWEPAEVAAALGEEDGRFFCEVYGITAAGNFEGRSIPNLLGGPLAESIVGANDGEDRLVRRVDPLRGRLLDARERRVWPGTDDKVLTAWNGLMISAFAHAYRVLGREEDLRSANRAADFVLRELQRDGRLMVTHREGSASLNGYLDDYAFFARGLLDLYEAGFDPRHLEAADRLAATLLERFVDAASGGFFFTSDDHEELLTRNRSLHDGALPAGAALATELLARLALHLDRSDYREAARRSLESTRPFVLRIASAHAAMLVAADFAAGPATEVALVGEPGEPATQALLARVHAAYRPRLILALLRPGADPGPSVLLAGKTMLDGRATAYVCRDYACQAPTNDPDDLERQLNEIWGQSFSS